MRDVKTIAVCGSMQFFSEMLELESQLKRRGFLVFLPQGEENESVYELLPADEKPALKKRFIDAHLSKIEKSDAVLVANFRKNGTDGYVGANTLMEVAFAYALKKRIFILHRLGEQGCKEEIDGLQPSLWSFEII